MTRRQMDLVRNANHIGVCLVKPALYPPQDAVYLVDYFCIAVLGLVEKAEKAIPSFCHGSRNRFCNR